MATTSTEKGRIEEALSKYNLDINDEDVKAAVKKIITEKVHENDTPEVKQFLMGSVELTTLKTTDSDESVMARKYGDQSFKEGEKDNLGEEMADVLWVLLCLANQTGVDLTEELQKSIEKKTQRDSLRHIHNKKLMA